MTIYAPGALMQLETYAWGTSQVGTVTIRVRSLADRSDAIAATTAGIAFDSTTKAHWIDTLTAPLTQGDYDAIWQSAGVQATERITVAYTALSPSSPTGSDLTTLAQVKNWLGISDTSQDARLQDLITSASGVIMDFCQDEFASVQGTASPRSFPLRRHPRGYHYANFGRYALQSASSVVVDSDQSPTGGTVTTYQLAPAGGDHGVYRHLRVYTTLRAPVSVTSYRFERVCSVAGTWGWPAIPAAVAEACIVTVAKWHRKDQTSYTNEFGAALPQEEASLSLPYDARMMLLPYRRSGAA